MTLGLEATGGFRTVAFCETDKYCRRVLRKHWPHVPIFGDIRELDAVGLFRAGVRPRVLCGGFPCQDISTAGNRAGLAGARSGLWREFARLIGELRPEYVLVENVSALLHRGLGEVLGDLAALGFDAEWHCIPAASLGAPHRRDRIWIVAYPQRDYLRDIAEREAGRRDDLPAGGQALARHDGAPGLVADTLRGGLERARGSLRADAQRGTAALAHPDGRGCESSGLEEYAAEQREPRALTHRCGESGRRDGPLADAGGEGLARSECAPLPRERRGNEGRTAPECGWWSVEPPVGRVAHGLSGRVDRLRALGNAVVPPVVELLGYSILNHLKDNNGL